MMALMWQWFNGNMGMIDSRRITTPCHSRAKGQNYKNATSRNLSRWRYSSGSSIVTPPEKPSHNVTVSPKLEDKSHDATEPPKLEDKGIRSHGATILAVINIRCGRTMTPHLNLRDIEGAVHWWIGDWLKSLQPEQDRIVSLARQTTVTRH